MLLTKPVSPTIVVRESRMRFPNDIAARRAVSNRYAWVCLLLVLLLLYNPFLMAPGSDGGLNVRHPASNRATVGSSELQHFTSAARQDFSGFADLAPAEGPFPAARSARTGLFPRFPRVLLSPAVLARELVVSAAARFLIIHLRR